MDIIQKIGCLAIGILIGYVGWLALKAIAKVFKPKPKDLPVVTIDPELEAINEANRIKANTLKLHILEDIRLSNLICSIPDIILRRNFRSYPLFTLGNHTRNSNNDTFGYHFKFLGHGESELKITIGKVEFKFTFKHTVDYTAFKDIEITEYFDIYGNVHPFTFSEIQMLSLLKSLFAYNYNAYLNDVDIFNNIIDFIGKEVDSPYPVNYGYESFTKFVFLNWPFLKHLNINMCILHKLGLKVGLSKRCFLECPTFLVINGGVISITFFKGMRNEATIKINNHNYLGHLTSNLEIGKSDIPTTLLDIHPLFVIHAFEKATEYLQDAVAATKIERFYVE